MGVAQILLLFFSFRCSGRKIGLPRFEPGSKCSQPKTLKPLLCRCPVVVGCRVPLQYPLISDNVSSLRCAYGRRTFARRFRVRLREFGICGFVVSTRGEASAACCQTRAETLREIFDVAVSVWWTADFPIASGVRHAYVKIGSATQTKLTDRLIPSPFRRRGRYIATPTCPHSQEKIGLRMRGFEPASRTFVTKSANHCSTVVRS